MAVNADDHTTTTTENTKVQMQEKYQSSQYSYKHSITVMSQYLFTSANKMKYDLKVI